jgi:hypothetical protein
MSDTANYLFANNGTNIFDEAEPYHYGEPLTLEEYFNAFDSNSIIDASNDTKLQDPKYAYDSGNIVESNTFYTENYPISYIKRGTFPIIGSETTAS